MGQWSNSTDCIFRSLTSGGSSSFSVDWEMLLSSLVQLYLLLLKAVQAKTGIRHCKFCNCTGNYKNYIIYSSISTIYKSVPDLTSTWIFPGFCLIFGLFLDFIDNGISYGFPLTYFGARLLMIDCISYKTEVEFGCVGDTIREQLQSCMLLFISIELQEPSGNCHFLWYGGHA